MRKLVWAVLLSILISALLVSGQGVTCTDTDNGPEGRAKAEPYVSTLGKVKYGLTEKQDECVSGSEGVHKDPSLWVREYFCGGDPVQRMYEDFDCTRYGYTGCQGGICVGKPNATSVTKPVVEGPACGNEKTDAGEQCDPPDKICYLNDKIGICTRPGAGGFGGCQCKVYTGGSGTVTENATISQETTATENVTVTPEANVIPENVTTAAEAETLPEQAPAEEQPPAERAPLPTEELPAKGIGVTRAITNAVKSFFSWIGSWFS